MADPAPPRIPTRSHSDPVAPPRRRQNTLSDLPATSPPSSGVTANLAREGRLGRVSSCSKTWHSYPVCFNPNHLFIVEYSDTLLADQSRTPLGSMGTYSTPIHMAMLRNGKILVVAGSGTAPWSVRMPRWRTLWSVEQFWSSGAGSEHGQHESVVGLFGYVLQLHDPVGGRANLTLMAAR